jgi:pyruvate/2-oxoglutarate dehydrogenase complex dihydrolipoamide acyltransferase (E2) component
LSAQFPGASGETVVSIFGSIMDKIFNHPSATPAPAAAAPTQAAAPAAPAAPASAPAAPASQPAVDVGAVLAEMASLKGGGGNYQTSIVDLLRLLDLDPSLEARKQLANELNVHAGADGSAEENIALHKAVIAKLAGNGGIVPDSLRS